MKLVVELCLRTIYFQFQEDFFEQTDGAAMGSPLSPIITNLFMEDLEQRVIQSAPLQPKLWVQYVDDTFVIWTHGKEELRAFHEHLNQQCPSIQFTIEEEKEERIAFLDVCMKRQGDKMSTAVYRNQHTQISTSLSAPTTTHES